jgi:sugar phosphate permease
VPFYLGIQLTILHWFRRREFGTMSGMRLMVGNLGGLVATQPLALLAESTGWRESLLILSAVMLAVSVLVALLVRDSPEDVGLAPLEGQLAPDTQERLPLGPALRIAWGLRNVWLLAAMYFLIYGAVNAFQGLWAVPFLIDARGLDRPSAAGLLAWWAWGTIVGAPAWGLLSDRVLHTRKGATILGYAIFALTWVPLTLLAGTPSWALAPLMFVASFGSASIVLGTPLLMELIPRQVMGTTSGLVNATPFLGAAVFQSAIGLALDAFGRTPSGAYPPHAYQTVFGVCLLCALGGTALLLAVRERARDG